MSYFKNNKENLLRALVLVTLFLTLMVVYIIIKDDEAQPMTVANKSVGVIPGIDPKIKLNYMRENGQVYPIDPRTNTALKFDPATNTPIVITPAAGDYLMSLQEKIDSEALNRKK